MERQKPANLWAVVLAAGEGSRMASLTRALYGHEMPKQFAALDGDKTLLQRTMDRIAPVTPPERTVVVVSDACEALARTQLEGYPGVEIVTQPGNLGTGPGILLPLAHVLARAPQANVAVYPSDHHVRRTEPFCDAVERAVRTAALSEDGVALLGAAAERAAVDLGWIVRGNRLGGPLDRAWQVHRFVEKPPEPLAMLLLGTGGLWNTMVIAGKGRAIWELARRHTPEQTRAFDRYLKQIAQPNLRAIREDLYRQMMPADFSREVLQAARGLGVVPLIDSGWFDCGTPERLFDWLRATPDMHGLLQRMEMAVARAARKPAAASSSVAAA
jgi:mannose-1-phosphate guanylyltransferase